MKQRQNKSRLSFCSLILQTPWSSSPMHTPMDAILLLGCEPPHFHWGRGYRWWDQCPAPKLDQHTETFWAGLRMPLRGLEVEMTHLQRWNLRSSTQPVTVENIKRKNIQNTRFSFSKRVTTFAVHLLDSTNISFPPLQDGSPHAQQLLWILGSFLSLSTYYSHAIIFVLPPSAAPSLHLFLPVAHYITFIPFTLLPVTLLKCPQMLLHFLAHPPSFLFHVLPYCIWEEFACKPKGCSLASMEGWAREAVLLLSGGSEAH